VVGGRGAGKTRAGAELVKALAQERQDDVGEIILTLVEQDTSDLRLNDSPVRDDPP
jgi:phage terminase large subunit-like protein